MMAKRNVGRGLTWAIVGGSVLVAGIVAIISSSIASQQDAVAPGSNSSVASSQAPKSTPLSSPVEDVVDATATDHGWRAEPITTDAETYVRAALEAASTFDTAKNGRDEWLANLATWFTPDTRYADADRPGRMSAALLELREGVVRPTDDWNSLAREGGRIAATVTGEVTLKPVAEDASGHMSVGTADVGLTITRSDSQGRETSYAEAVRVSVQVLCGEGSVPTPQSAQRAGDCKVVRFFTAPMES